MNNAQEYAEQQVRALGVNPNYSTHERMRLKEFTGYDLQDAYMAGYDKAVEKFCEWMQECEGYVVSGQKCNYENFIKAMGEEG